MNNYFDCWITESFKDLHYGDSGKFKVGETVTYISQRFLFHEVLKHFIGTEFIVEAVNVVDENSTEYLLRGFPFFVWENEIQSCLGKIKQDCTHNN